MSKKLSKRCAVPKCPNTSTKTPEKLFFYVPLDPKVRLIWMKAMKRVDPPAAKSVVYCCEDHFDVESDMENYIKYKLVGGQLKLKKDVVPHKFDCQGQVNKNHERVNLETIHTEETPKTEMEVTIKVEMESDSDKDAPLLEGSEQESRPLKTEPAEEHVWEVPIIPVGDIKCEYESDPEHDDELRRISSERRVKTEPAETDVEEVLSQAASMVPVIKGEVESDSGNDVPLSSIGLQQGREALKTEPEEKCVESVASDEKAGAEKRRRAADNSSNKTRAARGAPPRTGDARHQCNVCHKYCSTSSCLKTHLKTHIEKPYQCDVCQRRFTFKSNFKAHFRIHTGENLFECNVCFKRFAHRQKLNYHLIVHTGEKRFECNICQCRFTQKSSLQRHLVTHTGEKPFECNICQRRFTLKNYLEKHLLTHTAEKRFKCNICQSRFTRNDSLRQHLLTHTGEKCFECNICQRLFIKKSNLQRHLLTHTSEKPFECNICQSRFTRKGILQQHLLTHTGEKPF